MGYTKGRCARPLGGVICYLLSVIWAAGRRYQLSGPLRGVIGYLLSVICYLLSGFS